MYYEYYPTQIRLRIWPFTRCHMWALLHPLNFRFSTSESKRLTVTQIGDDVDLVKWSIIETHTGLICSCLITLKPLFARYIPSLLSSRSTESKTPVPPDAAWSLNVFSTHQSRPDRGHALAESLNSVDPRA
jgi:hypothetical protein